MLKPLKSYHFVVCFKTIEKPVVAWYLGVLATLVNPRGDASKPLKSYHFVVSFFYFWPFTQASLALSLNKKT